MITARRQLLTAAALLGAALATWIVTVQRMRGMDAGPGTDFHAVASDRVSLTPLQMDLTHPQQIPVVRTWLAK